MALRLPALMFDALRLHLSILHATINGHEAYKVAAADDDDSLWLDFELSRSLFRPKTSRSIWRVASQIIPHDGAFSKDLLN